MSSQSIKLSQEISRNVTKHQYGQDNILQSYELYIPEPHPQHLADPEQKYWIIFVHGGYFRDNTVTSSCFYPALELLASENVLHHHHNHLKLNDDSPDSSADIKPYIAGYASLNYRLSPRDKAPQDPQKTPTYELRNAKWPEHMHDVLAAIAHLQSKHGFGERYLLVGHSVGATMALLSALSPTKSPFSHTHGASTPKIDLPTAILGVSGIYDFPLIHKTFVGYDVLTRNAIPDEADDNLASPAKYEAKDFADAWTASGSKRRALIIAHSKDDGLVDMGQPEEMAGLLKEEANIEVKMMEIRGQHAAIYEKGTELARAILEAVGVMRGLSGGGRESRL